MSAGNTLLSCYVYAVSARRKKDHGTAYYIYSGGHSRAFGCSGRFYGDSPVSAGGSLSVCAVPYYGVDIDPVWLDIGGLS